MRLIAWSTLAEYAAIHPDAKAALESWREIIKQAAWRSMSEAANALSKAKSVGGDRIRYDLAGGDYRLIVAYDFERQITFVKFIGTHAEYDKIDAATVGLF
jgi:mRNA interferase HigB